MQRRLSASFAALLIVVVAGCSPGDRQPATTGTGAPPTVAAPPPPALDSKQVEALAFMAAISEQEVAAAEQARGKQVEAGIRAYADRLHAEHSTDLEQTLAVASKVGVTISDSNDVKALRAEGQADLERLAALDEKDYPAAYLEAMVALHAKAGKLIDERLLPAAGTEAVRKHLVAARARIAEHLAAAQGLQAPVK